MIGMLYRTNVTDEKYLVHLNSSFKYMRNTQIKG